MDVKKKICLMLATFFVLSFPSICVVKTQAWDGTLPDVPPPIEKPNGPELPTHPPTTPPPPPTIGNVYSAAVCVSEGNITEACFNRDVKKATTGLSVTIIKKCLLGYIDAKFLVSFPVLYPYYQTITALATIEIQAIQMTKAKLEDDFRKLRAFKWPTEAERQQALLIIQKDEKTLNKWNREDREDREEASRNANWSHNWNNNSHEFHPGPAYEQLKTIASIGWLNR